MENFIREYILTNLNPELVEKNDPPIIIRIIKINIRFWGTSKEKPILEIELQIAKKSKEKLLLELKKIKKIIAKKTK